MKVLTLWCEGSDTLGFIKPRLFFFKTDDKPLKSFIKTLILDLD